MSFMGNEIEQFGVAGESRTSQIRSNAPNVERSSW